MEIFEINKSQSGEIARNAKNSFDRTFCVIASLSDSFNAVQVAVRALLPDTEANMVLTSVSPREEDRSDTQRFWTVQARYRNPDHPDAREEKETGDYEVSFDTTGGTATRTHAISQRYYDDDSGVSKPSNSLAIGWNGTEAKGVEVVIPTLRFQETHYIPDNIVRNPNWIKDLSRATGKTNSMAFRGFNPREILFLGASGSQRGRGDWPVTFYGSGSETVTGMMKGDIKVGVKYGQEHLWIEDTVELDTNTSAPVPSRVYVSQIADETDFNAFWPAIT